MWEIDRLKLFSRELLRCSEKNLRILISCPMDTVEKVPKILNYSIASIKLHSDAIISFPNKLKINHITIFTNLLILQQKIINTYWYVNFSEISFECWNFLFFWNTFGRNEYLSNWRQCTSSETCLFFVYLFFLKSSIFKHLAMLFLFQNFNSLC